MATLAQLEEGLVKAYNAGDMDSARKLAAVITEARKDKSLLIAGAENVEIPGTSEPKPSRTIGERAKGAGEAALSMATGATTGTVGAVAGALGGAARVVEAGTFGTKQGADQIEQSAMRGAEAGTYAPRTQAGQEYVQNVGEVMAPLGAVAPMSQMLAAGASVPATVSSAGAMIPAAAQRVRQAAAPIQRAAQAAIEPVQGAIQSARTSGPFAARSVGAAEVPSAVVRRERAAQMPVPLEGDTALTRGQASRDFEQLQFEKETAKVGDVGAELRTRAMNQNEAIQQNFDALVDRANPQYLDKQAIGGAVDRALVNRANTVMRKVSQAYKAADEAGELEMPVQMKGLAGKLQEVEDFRPFLETEMNAIERQAVRMGALVPDENGALQPGQITLRQSETLRQFINDSIDWTDKRQARVGRILKDGIDESTEGAGGQAYARARALYRQQVAELENAALTRKLLNTKRNSDERNIAIEDVYDRVIVRSSVEEMNKLRGSLIKAGPEGKQAWANLKAKAIDDIKEQGLMQATDERGNRVLSPAGLNKAIERLDQSGKLEALYGKKQAQVIRDLGEISRDVMSAPPGAVNFSNTASALRVALDSVLTFGITGIPAPAATALKEAAKYMRDRQTRNRVREALSQPPNQQQSGRF